MQRLKYLCVVFFVVIIEVACSSVGGVIDDAVTNNPGEYIIVDKETSNFGEYSTNNEDVTEEKTSTHNALPDSSNGNKYDEYIVKNSYLWSEPFPSWVDALDGENYTPLVEVISAEGVISATKLEIPETINGSKRERVVSYIEGDRCIVKLDSDEIGIFYYFTGEYRKITSCNILNNVEADFFFMGYDAEKLVLLSSAPGNGVTCDAKLWLYDIASDELKVIYTYNTRENSKSNISVDKVCVMVETGIYFTDGFVWEIDNMPHGSILFYDYEKDTVEIDRKFATEPIKYGDSYACFIKSDATNNYKSLVDSMGNILWEVDEYGRDIDSNGKDIFVTAMANDDEMMVTRTGFMTLDKKYIFTTYRNGAISDVTPMAMLPQVDCLNEEYAFLYDLKLGQLIQLDNIPKCTHFMYTNVSEDGKKMILEVNRFKESYLLEYR